MLRFLVGLLYTLVALLTLSCAPSGDTRKAEKPPFSEGFVNELGYNPSQRWPEQGDYSYDFKIRIDGVECVAKQSFKSKSDYCMGLQDATLNNRCSLGGRKNSYQTRCGFDFQEINFPTDFSVDGFDQRLNRYCETGKARDTVFPLKKHFCAFLKDEDLHQECHWDQRRESFEALECPGFFSEEPVETRPLPTGQPTATPVPTATPIIKPRDPLNEIAIVRELRAEGVEVTVDWPSIHQDRGFGSHPPLEQQMQQFWKELEAVKDQILAHKKDLQKLRVTSYTSYFASGRSLAIQYDLHPGQFEFYFQLYDQVRNLEQELGFTADTIHGFGANDARWFDPLQSLLDVLRKHRLSLIAIKGVIKNVTVDSYSSFSTFDSDLTLNQNQLEKDLIEYIGLLKPLAPLYQWCLKNQVQMDFDFNIEEQTSKIHNVANILSESFPALSQMVQAKMLKVLDISYFQSESSFSPSLHRLQVEVIIEGTPALRSQLRLLGSQAQKSLELQRPIESVNEKLDAHYQQNMEQLDKVWSRVVGKKAKIKMIELGWESDYKSFSETLSIGYQSSLAKTIQVIDSI